MNNTLHEKVIILKEKITQLRVKLESLELSDKSSLENNLKELEEAAEMIFSKIETKV